MKAFIGFWSKPVLDRVRLLTSSGGESGAHHYFQAAQCALAISVNSLRRNGFQVVVLTDTPGKEIVYGAKIRGASEVLTVFDALQPRNSMFQGIEKFWAISNIDEAKKEYLYSDYLCFVGSIPIPTKKEQLFLESFLTSNEPGPQTRTGDLIKTSLALSEAIGFVGNHAKTLGLQAVTSYGVLPKSLSSWHNTDVVFYVSPQPLMVEISNSVIGFVDKIQGLIDEEHLNLGFAHLSKPSALVDSIANAAIQRAIENGQTIDYVFDQGISINRSNSGAQIALPSFQHIKNKFGNFKVEPHKIQDWMEVAQGARSFCAQNSISVFPISFVDLNGSAASTNDDKPPGILRMAKNLGVAMVDFAVSGFSRVTARQHQDRMKICGSCEFWEPGARLGLGKCLKCGCTGAKQWIAASVCPINKWGAISREEVKKSLEEEYAEKQSPVSEQADDSQQGVSN